MSHVFYWLNWYHDKLYSVGFDASSGAFQTVNPNGGSGVGNDPVIVDAQDKGQINNSSANGPEVESDGNPG